MFIGKIMESDVNLHNEINKAIGHIWHRGDTCILHYSKEQYKNVLLTEIQFKPKRLFA